MHNKTPEQLATEYAMTNPQYGLLSLNGKLTTEDERSFLAGFRAGYSAICEALSEMSKDHSPLVTMKLLHKILGISPPEPKEKPSNCEPPTLEYPIDINDKHD